AEGGRPRPHHRPRRRRHRRRAGPGGGPHLRPAGDRLRRGPRRERRRPRPGPAGHRLRRERSRLPRPTPRRRRGQRTARPHLRREGPPRPLRRRGRGAAATSPRRDRVHPHRAHPGGTTMRIPKASVVATVAALFAALTGCGFLTGESAPSASDGTCTEQNLRLATIRAEDDPATLAANHFAESVARATDGRITVRVFPNS